MVKMKTTLKVTGIVWLMIIVFVGSIVGCTILFNYLQIDGIDVNGWQTLAILVCIAICLTVLVVGTIWICTITNY
jgi:hypothetical protein